MFEAHPTGKGPLKHWGNYILTAQKGVVTWFTKRCVSHKSKMWGVYNLIVQIEKFNICDAYLCQSSQRGYKIDQTLFFHYETFVSEQSV